MVNLALLPKLHLKNFNETENKEEPSTALYRECVHVQVSLYVSNVFLKLVVRIFGVSGGSKTAGPASTTHQ